MLVKIITLVCLAACSMKSIACDEAVNPVEPLNLDGLVRDVRDAHVYFMSSQNPDAVGTFTERISKRNSVIKARFTKFKGNRSTAYSDYRCRRDVVHLKCKGGKSGTSTTCRDDQVAPENQIFIADQISIRGDGYGHKLIDADTRIKWHVRVTGTRTNHGRLTAWTKYSSAGIDRAVESDTLLLRHRLAAESLPDGL